MDRIKLFNATQKYWRVLSEAWSKGPKLDGQTDETYKQVWLLAKKLYKEITGENEFLVFDMIRGIPQSSTQKVNEDE